MTKETSEEHEPESMTSSSESDDEVLEWKEYEIKSGAGYKYSDLFKVVPTRRKRGDLVLNLNLAVITAKEAHILLSPTDEISRDTPLYEIVIGAGDNTHNVIRRKRQNENMEFFDFKNLLSLTEPLPLKVQVTNSGSVRVFTTTESVPIVDVKDPSPLPIKYVAFSTNGELFAKWYYCVNDENSDKLELFKHNLEDIQ